MKKRLHISLLGIQRVNYQFERFPRNECDTQHTLQKQNRTAQVKAYFQVSFINTTKNPWGMTLALFPPTKGNIIIGFCKSRSTAVHCHDYNPQNTNPHLARPYGLEAELSIWTPRKCRLCLRRYQYNRPTTHYQCGREQQSTQFFLPGKNAGGSCLVAISYLQVLIARSFACVNL